MANIHITWSRFFAVPPTYHYVHLCEIKIRSPSIALQSTSLSPRWKNTTIIIKIFFLELSFQTLFSLYTPCFVGLSVGPSIPFFHVFAVVGLSAPAQKFQCPPARYSSSRVSGLVTMTYQKNAFRLHRLAQMSFANPLALHKVPADHVLSIRNNDSRIEFQASSI